MNVAVGSLAHRSEGAAATGAFVTQSYRCHLHVETGQLCTRNVERSVAVGAMALNAGSGTAASADAARQASTGRRDPLQSIDRLKEHVIREANFGDPQRTCNMSPAAVAGLFERSTAVWTKTAVNGT